MSHILVPFMKSTKCTMVNIQMSEEDSIAVPLFTNSETAAVTPLRRVWNFLLALTQWKVIEPNVSWQISPPMHLN